MLFYNFLSVCNAIMLIVAIFNVNFQISMFDFWFSVFRKFSILTLSRVSATVEGGSKRQMQ